jgi:hypothetical protein
MKLKSLATSILAGGLLIAAGSSFGVPCSTLATVSAWKAAGSCTDTDAVSDTTWTFTSSSFTAAQLLQITFAVSEGEGVGFDVYNVAFGFNPALNSTNAGATIAFTGTVNNAELFDAANYDTNVTEPVGFSGAVSTAQITGASGPVSLLLTSTDGSHAPAPSGETPFTNNTTIAALDTFGTIPAGIVLNAANNSFQTGTPARKIPEPATLLLIGAALAGAGFARRRKQS